MKKTDIRSQLEEVLDEDESLIWCGTPEQGKIFTKVYTRSYLLNIILSYAVCGFVALMSVRHNLADGDPVDLVPVFLMLAIGSILPGTTIEDFLICNHLL